MKRKNILTSFLAVSVILITLLVFFYIKGYRFDFDTQEVLTTGILTIDSVPSKSDLYIDEISKGKTPKTVTLSTGEFEVNIKKDGYHDWNKKVDIKEGMLTTIKPWLIKTNIKEDILSSANKIVDTEKITETKRDIFIPLYEESNDNRSYKVIKFSTTSEIWDFSENPDTVLTFTKGIDSSFNIAPSPDSSKLLFTIDNGDTKNRYILNTNTENAIANIDPIELNGFNEYDIFWNNSSEFLILESDTDILTYNIDSKIKYLITKKTADEMFVWTTDENGLFFLIQGKEEETVYHYTLSQYSYDGTFQKKIIEDLYFQTSEDNLSGYRDSTLTFGSSFKNSQESTRSSGKILTFSIYHDSKGMFLETEFASYWYNLETSRFTMIAPYKTELLGISPSNDKVLFENEKEVGIFILDKEDGDYTQNIGDRLVWDQDPKGISNVQWLSNGEYVLFNKDSQVYVSDYSGENIVNIFTNNTLFSKPSGNESYIFISTINEAEEFIITRLTIH